MLSRLFTENFHKLLSFLLHRGVRINFIDKIVKPFLGNHKKRSAAFSCRILEKELYYEENGFFFEMMVSYAYLLTAETGNAQKENLHENTAQYQAGTTQ